MPFAEAAFSSGEGQQEIIEDYSEEEEMRWREKHKQRVAEHKQREAAQRLANVEDGKEYLAKLDQALLMEELEDELENMDVENDEQFLAQLTEITAETGEAITNEESADEDPSTDSDESEATTDNGSVEDSVEFDILSRSAKDMSTADKIEFYKEKLREVKEYFSTKQISTPDDLNEKLEKLVLRESLVSAIYHLRDEMSAAATTEALSDIQPTENGQLPHMNGDENEQDQQQQQLQQTHTHFNRKDFARLEQEYVSRSKGEQLVFYKSQLRSAIKFIASTSPNAEQDERRSLYEYLSGRIDQLRTDILKEKQAQMEERFVDDNSDSEINRKTDLDDSYLDGSNDYCQCSDNEDGIEIGAADAKSNAPLKRRISFADQPIITTYNQDEEPLCIHRSHAENMKALLDSAFEFFDDDSDEHAGDDDRDSAGAPAINCDQLRNSDSNEELAAATEINSMPNLNAPIVGDLDDIIGDDNSQTLHIQFNQSIPFNHSAHIAQPSNSNIIQTPADIYHAFAPSQEDLLKKYVTNVANLDMNDVTQRMQQMYAAKHAEQQQQPEADKCESVHEFNLSGVNPIKSILKNKGAVSLESHCSRTVGQSVHQKYDDYENDECEVDADFAGFDSVCPIQFNSIQLIVMQYIIFIVVLLQIVSDIKENFSVENVAMKSTQPEGDLSAGDPGAKATKSTDEMTTKPVSLFKQSRRQ